MRFVLEGRGATTTVDGELAPMHPGDFIITPSMGRHAHHGGDEPMIRQLSHRTGRQGGAAGRLN